MPIQLMMWERRENGNREIMGNTALELCQTIRMGEGITSARFYWNGSENIVLWVEGEIAALDFPDQKINSDCHRLVLAIGDNANQLLNMRLLEPQIGSWVWSEPSNGEQRCVVYQD